MDCYTLRRARIDTQELINPKKSCRWNSCVSDVGACLGNMPEVVLIQNFWRRRVLFLQNSYFPISEMSFVTSNRTMLSIYFAKKFFIITTLGMFS